MNERIVIKTQVHELKPLSVTFEHKVYEKETNTLRVIAHTTIVVTNAQTGKMYRRIPEYIYKEFEKAVKVPV
jgi:acyl-CoA thioesterase FadM